MIYSVVPNEVIFNKSNNLNNLNNEDNNRQLCDITVQGVKMQAVNLGNGEYIIERLISTDLKNYLNSNFSPGKTLVL